MSQEPLYDASVYCLRAYDQLALAYNVSELDELRSLKTQTIRVWQSLQELSLSSAVIPRPLLDEGAFDLD